MNRYELKSSITTPRYQIKSGILFSDTILVDNSNLDSKVENNMSQIKGLNKIVSNNIESLSSLSEDLQKIKNIENTVELTPFQNVLDTKIHEWTNAGVEISKDMKFVAPMKEILNSIITDATQLLTDVKRMDHIRIDPFNEELIEKGSSVIFPDNQGLISKSISQWIFYLFGRTIWNEYYSKQISSEIDNTDLKNLVSSIQLLEDTKFSDCFDERVKLWISFFSENWGHYETLNKNESDILGVDVQDPSNSISGIFQEVYKLIASCKTSLKELENISVFPYKHMSEDEAKLIGVTDNQKEEIYSLKGWLEELNKRVQNNILYTTINRNAITDINSKLNNGTGGNSDPKLYTILRRYCNKDGHIDYTEFKPNDNGTHNHFCSLCDYNFIENEPCLFDENYTCTICKLKCLHKQMINGICQICKYECSHDWNNGTCSKCNLSCNHIWNDGSCSNCNLVCSHENVYEIITSEPSCQVYGTKDFRCAICNKLTSSSVINPLGHEWNDGTCSRCSTTCSHDWNNGTCSICGSSHVHNWYEGVCQICGEECNHDWQDGVCQNCNWICDHWGIMSGDVRSAHCNRCGWECPDHTCSDERTAARGWTCPSCTYTCPHDQSSGLKGRCDYCQWYCPLHDVENGGCSTCGYQCFNHDGMGNCECEEENH